MRHEAPDTSFDPAVLHETVRRAVAENPAEPVEARIEAVVALLQRRYPALIDDASPWLFNNAGGAMGAVRFLHVSPREYLILFGTAIGTEGHTGRLPAHDWFFIIDGEQWTYSPGELDPTIYRAGQCHHLQRGVSRAYRMPGRCWALEYARGSIPLMFPFGLADALTSTLDYQSALTLIRVAGGGMLRSLARRWRAVRP